MNATAKLRHRAGRRVTSALWGLFVMGAGGLMIAGLSGFWIDFQLATIVVLSALGVWLLLTAAVSGIGRHKDVARATAPVVEEPAVQEPAVEEPTVEEPAVQEPVADNPAVDEPAVVEPAPKPAATKPAATKPATKKPATKKPATAKPAKKAPAPEKSTPEKPAED